MDWNCYKKIANKQKELENEIFEPIITIDELSDKSDKTLMFGFNENNEKVHVYIQNNKIYKYIYSASSSTKRLYEPEQLFTNADYIPTKLVYPEACDYEFCNLLSYLGYKIPFNKVFNNNDYRINNNSPFKYFFLANVASQIIIIEHNKDMKDILERKEKEKK